MISFSKNIVHRHAENVTRSRDILALGTVRNSWERAREASNRLAYCVDPEFSLRTRWDLEHASGELIGMEWGRKLLPCSSLFYDQDISNS